MLIDAHVHVQPWRMLKPAARALIEAKRPDARMISELMYDPAEFLRHLDRERVDHVVSINYVSPDVMGFTEEVNAYAADFARASKGRVIPFGSLHPTAAPGAERAMRDLIGQGIRGIKVHPSHQACYPNAYRQGNRVLEITYRRAEEAGLVLMVHTGTSIFPSARNVYSDPIHCEDIAVDFPKLRVILAHAGRPLWMETAVFLVRRFPNVYMDVSSIPPRKLLEYFPTLEDLRDKTLWGTDWPAPGVPGMRENADRFLALPLSDEAKRKITHENAKRLFGL